LTAAVSSGNGKVTARKEVSFQDQKNVTPQAMKGTGCEEEPSSESAPKDHAVSGNGPVGACSSNKSGARAGEALLDSEETEASVQDNRAGLKAEAGEMADDQLPEPPLMPKV
jgi:hypothetical protein